MSWKPEETEKIYRLKKSEEIQLNTTPVPILDPRLKGAEEEVLRDHNDLIDSIGKHMVGLVKVIYQW